MSVGEWVTFCQHLGLVESGQLTLLAAKNIYLWSRIRSADDLTEASESRLRNLSAVDFYEALVRMSIMVALPTDMEIEEAGAADAGAFLLAMQANAPRTYREFLQTHRPKLGDPDGSDYDDVALQPAERCLEHLIKLLVRTVEHNKSATAASDEAAADGLIEEDEAVRFLKRRQAGHGLERFGASLTDVNFGERLEAAAAKQLFTVAAIKIQMMLRARKARERVAERKAAAAAAAAAAEEDGE